MDVSESGCCVDTGLDAVENALDALAVCSSMGSKADVDCFDGKDVFAIGSGLEDYIGEEPGTRYRSRYSEVAAHETRPKIECLFVLVTKGNLIQHWL